MVPLRHPMILIWPPASREFIRNAEWANASEVFLVTDYLIPIGSKMITTMSCE